MRDMILLFLIAFLMSPTAYADQEIAIEEDLTRGKDITHLTSATVDDVYTERFTDDLIIKLHIPGYYAEEIDPDLAPIIHGYIYLLEDAINVHFVIGVSFYMIATDDGIQPQSVAYGRLYSGYLEDFFGGVPKAEGLEVKIVLLR